MRNVSKNSEDHGGKKRRGEAAGPVSEILCVCAMFLLIIALLFSSFQLVLYGPFSEQLFLREYEKYDVAASLDMSGDDIARVSSFMMSYLAGGKSELSIDVEIDGKTQDFFNDHDRTHMELVQNMFTGVFRIRNAAAAGAGVMLFIAVMLLHIKSRNKRVHSGESILMIGFDTVRRSYNIALAVLVAALGVFGAACAVNFTAVFTKFHEIFFAGDEWLFDPAQDFMIRMLPEGLFADFVLYIMIVFIAFLALIWITLHFVSGKMDKRRAKTRLD